MARSIDHPKERGIPDQVLTFGPFRFLPQQRLLMRDGLPLRVGSRALDILAVLVHRPREVITKNDIIAQVWPDTIVEEINLRVHLTALRKILSEGHVGSRFIETIPGRGYSFVASITHEDNSPIDSSPPSASIRFNNLPGTVSEVIGRDAVIAALVAQLPQRRLISLVGPGGVGKTTVALAVADKLAPLYEEGVVFIDLATISDSSLVARAVASTLGCALGSQDPIEDLVKFLGARRLLLLLDNCEHVVSGCATLVAALLKGSRSIVILSTSREPLRTAGEWVQQLPPLALPPLSASSSLQEAMLYPAVRLFVDRACAALSSFNPTNLDAPMIVDICNRLDGIALAIELAAGRINSVGLRTLSSSLDTSLNVLAHGRRTAVPRHQALHNLLDWSFQLLSPLEQVVLLRLGVFNGPFSLDAARNVCSGHEAPIDAIEEALINLLAKSLVTADVGGDSVRYRLLQTTRAYVRERLEKDDQRDDLDRAHANYYRRFFEQAESEWETRPTAQWREAYRDQVGNLRSAVTWCFASGGDSSLGIAITVAAIPLWFQMSLVDECLERVLQALSLLDHAHSRSDRTRMKLYAALGWPYMGAIAATRGGASAWREALDIARKLDDIDYQLRSLWALWVDRKNSGQPREGLELAREFICVATRTNEPADGWIGERMLGMSFHLLGDQPSAKRHLEKMLTFYVEPSSRSHAIRFQFDQRVTARVPLSRALWLEGHTDQALAEVRDTLIMAQHIDHHLSLAHALAEAACPIALMSGELELADHYIAMLEEQTRAQSLDVWSTYAECFRGEVLIARGQTARGLAMVQTGLNKLRLGGFLLFECAFLGSLARGYLAAAHAADGLAYISEALQKCEASGEGWCIPELLRIQGELLMAQDIDDAAFKSEAAFLRSFETSREYGTGAWELRTAISCANLYARNNRHSEIEPLLAPLLQRFSTQTSSHDVAEAARVLKQMKARTLP